MKQKPTTHPGKTLLHILRFLSLSLCCAALFSGVARGGKDEKKDEKKDKTDSASIAIREDNLSKLARLIPRNVLKAKTGDLTTDNVFSNYSLPQVQLMIEEYDAKLENARIQKTDLTRASLETGERFLRTFPDSRVIDEIAIRHADLLYEKVTDDYAREKGAYDKALIQFDKETELYAKGDLKTPPTEPIEPSKNLDRVISLYDLIINNMKDSPYVVDALYNKAYIYGEREATQAKKQEATELLKQVIAKYPDSRYTIDSYMLIGEYLFGATRPQPEKTQEAIPYYKKALEIITEKGIQTKYYNQALYKLGWAYFRVRDFDEAITHFTALSDDIDKAEELFANKLMPDYVRTDLKDEALEYIAISFLNIQKSKVAEGKANDKFSGVDRVERYFSQMNAPRRYAPIVYQRMAEGYENLLEDPEKINECYKTLLRLHPKYELAPVIGQKIIESLDRATLTEQGTKNDTVQQQLYEERKRLFYSYGRTSDWYKDLLRRIEAQNRGDTLPFEDRPVFGSSFDPKLVALTDSITRIALFANILYAADEAEVLSGYQPPPLGVEKPKNPPKGQQLYRQVVEDAENYVKLFSRYDSTAYEALWNRSFILDQRLLPITRRDEAVNGYVDLAKNFAWDHRRKDALFFAYNIVDSTTAARKTGIYSPNIDSLRFNGPPLPLTDEESKYISVVDAIVRLFPHDTLATKGVSSIATIYAMKGDTLNYKIQNARLTSYYPIQEVPPFTLYNVMEQAFQTGDYVVSEQMGKAIFYGKPNSDKKDKERRKLAYGRIGESIYKRGNLYYAKGNYLAAAREYERAVYEVPDWKFRDSMAVFASSNYIRAERPEEARRISEYLISNSKDTSLVKKGYQLIVDAYLKVKNYDSVAAANERLAEVYSYTDSVLAERGLINAIGASKLAAQDAKEKNERPKEIASWKNAIRVSDKYLTRFPFSKNSDQIAFSKIGLNESAGDSTGTFSAYGEYAAKYIDKPLGVLAYYKRGEYLEKRGDVPGAKKEYAAAVSRFDALPTKVKDDAGYYTSESIYKLNNFLIEDYKKIPIRMIIKPAAFEKPKTPKAPKRAVASKTKKGKSGATASVPVAAPKSNPNADIDYDRAEKDAALAQIEAYNKRLFALSGYRAIEATTNAGTVRENYAEKFALLPDTLKKATLNGKNIVGYKLALNTGRANGDAATQYLVAGGVYGGVADKLTQSREIYSKKQKGQLAIDTVQIGATPEAGKDSLLAITDTAIARARNRVIDMYYRAGTMMERNVQTYLDYHEDVDPSKAVIKIPKTKYKIDIGDILALQTDAKLATDFVRPQQEEAIKIYKSGIEKAKELNIQNEVVDSCNQGISRVASKSAERVDSIARTALELFDKLDRQYRVYLDSLSGSKAPPKDYAFFYGMGGVNSAKLNNYIGSNFQLALQGYKEYMASLKLLKDANGSPTEINRIAEKTAKFVYDLGDGNISRARDLEKAAKGFDETAKKDFAKFWYSDAAFNYKPFSKLFDRYGLEVLSGALSLVNDYDIQNQYTDRAIRSYVNHPQIKPTLGALLGDAVEETSTQATGSDASGGGWKVSQKVGAFDTWYSKEYDDKEWTSATVNAAETPLEYLKITESRDDSDKTVTKIDRMTVAARSIWNGTRQNNLVPPPPPKPKAVDSAATTPKSKPDSAGTTPKSSVTPDTKSGTKPADSKTVEPKPLDTGKPETKPSTVPGTGDTKSSGAKDSLGVTKPAGADSAATTGVKTDSAGVKSDSSATDSTKKAAPKKGGKKPKKKTGFLDRAPERTVADAVHPEVISLYVNTRYSAQSKKKKKTKEPEPPPATTTPAAPPKPKEDPNNVYFRKEFTVNGVAKLAQLIISNDDLLVRDSTGKVNEEKKRIEIYCNNDPVENAFRDSVNLNQTIFDITSFVSPGKNIIAIKAPVDTKSDGIKAAINVVTFKELTPDQIKKIVEYDKKNRSKVKK